MRREDPDRARVFTRRAALLGGAQGALFAVLAGRMYYLQVVEADRWATLAEDNRVDMRLLPPPRGRILDRFGNEIAGNQRNYRVVLIPEQTQARTGGQRAKLVETVGDTLTVLAGLVEVPEHERRRVLREVERKRRFIPVTVIENLTWEEFSRVNVNAPDIPGINPEVGLTRHYPDGQTFAHVVGYVGAVSEDELTDDPLLELPGFRIGKAGVEKVLDTQLRGLAGNSRVEVNAVGRVIRELERQDGQSGSNVTLTLDAELQRHALESLGAESGAVVAMDVRNGEVLAMASAPSFDANWFNLGLSTGRWNDLLNHPRKPLLDKATRGQYPPGSTFKMLVCLAALEAGIVTDAETVFCPGHLDFGNNRFHCWKRGGHGTVDMRAAIYVSCDVWFYEVARKVGIDRIARMARRFGLGTAPDVALPGVKAGLVPDRAWKRGALGEAWHPGETLVAGIGQGYLLTTPLQLAVMTARLANGSVAVHPVLVKSVGGTAVDNPNLIAPQSLGIAPRNMQIVQEGMDLVLSGPRGTARASQIPEAYGRMAGKTGTAQVKRITRAEREAGLVRQEDRPWQDRHHALFVGYAPYDRPKYAVAVVIEHGGSGSGAAAPVARDVMTKLMERDPGGTLAGGAPRNGEPG